MDGFYFFVVFLAMCWMLAIVVAGMIFGSILWAVIAFVVGGIVVLGLGSFL